MKRIHRLGLGRIFLPVLSIVTIATASAYFANTTSYADTATDAAPTSSDTTTPSADPDVVGLHRLIDDGVDNGSDGYCTAVDQDSSSNGAHIDMNVCNAGTASQQINIAPYYHNGSYHVQCGSNPWPFVNGSGFNNEFCGDAAVHLEHADDQSKCYTFYAPQFFGVRQEPCSNTGTLWVEDNDGLVKDLVHVYTTNQEYGINGIYSILCAGHHLQNAYVDTPDTCGPFYGTFRYLNP